MANSDEETIAAVHDFYSTIIRLPYVDTDALVLPPPEGWSGVNADELRKRGKTEEVIELLRHLPCLRNPGNNRKWMLSPNTLAIAYCDGEVYDPLLDELQPTPAHCIWLTAHDSRDGTDLLLDTHAGSITEWSMLEKGLMVDYADYEGMDKTDRWMCYPTMAIVDFFKLWQARWEKLVWIPIYNPRGGPATASWWYRANPGSDEEEYILLSDDEYEPTDDDSDDDGSVDSGVGSEGDEDDLRGGGDESASKITVSDREGDKGDVSDSGSDSSDESASKTTSSDRKFNDTPKDTVEEEDQTVGIKLTSEAEESVDDTTPASRPRLDTQTWNDMSAEKVPDALYTVFQGNGWPDRFDREQCRAELSEFHQSRHC
ncbi:hypothetical protein F4803DRAFT_532815 [Xylaria telfairii]|nr:hypothetical protein F4803DRAFT_532815 [Xylaria telfairii]